MIDVEKLWNDLHGFHGGEPLKMGHVEFAKAILEQAALACESMNSYDEYDPMGSCAAAIRAMKPEAK